MTALRAGTITVNSGADAGGTCPGATCTLRQAIATAASGETINFAAGLTAVTLTSAELLINKNLTIAGPGASQLIVRRSTAGGTPQFRIFRISSGNFTFVLSGLTITNGIANSSRGGAILNQGTGTVTISECVISGNSATSPTFFAPDGYGGGVFAESSSSTVITKSTISGNSADYDGGGIYDSGSLTISDSTIAGNTTLSGTGGGIRHAGTGSLTVANSTISGNVARISSGSTGGGLFATAPVGIANSTVSGNSAASGGGIYASANITVTNSTVANNSAQDSGGGIFNNNVSVIARNSIIARNLSSGSEPDFRGTLASNGYNLIGNTSGASITGNTTGNQTNVDPKLGPLQNNGGPTLTQALLSSSPAIEGGNSSTGGYNTDQRGFARPVDTPVITNASGGDGSDIGAYEVQGDQLPGCGNTLVTNSNDSGAGSLRSIITNVCAGETITFAPSVASPINLTTGELVVDKQMTIRGPGANVLTVQRSVSATTNFPIFHVVERAEISGLTITKGNPPFNGGGISWNGLNSGPLTVRGCVITGNSANNTGQLTASGGGISAKDLIVIDSTVSGNSATQDGGGISSSGTTTITNCTISGNSAVRYSGGVHPSGSLTVRNSTIANNTAGTGGGIRNGGFPVSLRNTVVAKNTATTADPDLSGPLTSQGFNFIGNNTGANITPAQFTDQIGTSASPKDPLLGPLQDNGGPTLTRTLLSGSTAIDQGDSSSSSTDQRGFTRPVDFSAIANVAGGDGSDIGAFEVQAPTPTPTPTPTATPSTLANISTRLRVETGDNALIGGFIVTGTQDKKVIIRGIGPSLGLADQLSNPTLELYFGQTLLKANDDWMNSSPADKQAIIDSTIPPTNDAESAIVATLPANGAGYTAVLRGVNNGTGIGVIQIYDLDRSVDSKLANISTRGFVQTGDNVLFAGMIVLGQAAQKVIIRALGPSVPAPGAMADPTLELRDGNGALLDLNDNWKDSPNKQAIIDSTIPPTQDAESAIVYNLPANGANYTAIVRGAGGTTGIAVVEVYALN